MYNYKGETYIEEIDQCNTCEYQFNNFCPFLQAIYYGIVTLDSEGTQITNCELYKERKITPLRRIK